MTREKDRSGQKNERTGEGGERSRLGVRGGGWTWGGLGGEARQALERGLGGCLGSHSLLFAVRRWRRFGGEGGHTQIKAGSEMKGVGGGRAHFGTGAPPLTFVKADEHTAAERDKTPRG